MLVTLVQTLVSLAQNLALLRTSSAKILEWVDRLQLLDLGVAVLCPLVVISVVRVISVDAAWVRLSSLVVEVLLGLPEEMVTVGRLWCRRIGCCDLLVLIIKI